MATLFETHTRRTFCTRRHLFEQVFNHVHALMTPMPMSWIMRKECEQVASLPLRRYSRGINETYKLFESGDDTYTRGLRTTASLARSAEFQIWNSICKTRLSQSVTNVTRRDRRRSFPLTIPSFPHHSFHFTTHSQYRHVRRIFQRLTASARTHRGAFSQAQSSCQWNFHCQEGESGIKKRRPQQRNI